MDAAKHDELGIGSRGSLACELERVSGYIRELDYLIALVVVAQNEGAVAERLAGRSRSRYQAWVTSRRQLTRAAHAALCGWIGPRAEHKQRQRTARPGSFGKICLAGRRGHRNPDPLRLIV